MASKLAEQRTAAIRAVHSTIAPAPEHKLVLSADEVTAQIRSLKRLSRALCWCGCRPSLRH
jgi:hypothetical protein